MESTEEDENVIKRLKEEGNLEYNESLINEENNKNEVSKSGSNVSLIFQTDRLVFFSVLNHVVSSILTVYNNGTTAIHFEWRKIKRDNNITKV